jgi:alanine-glyoxylate transaminase/serine-glyoxylate transaminase/serine-pyruvate transaminase
MSQARSMGEPTVPERTLMRPGPSDVPPRVLRAMATPVVGHLDPSFVELVDEVRELLRNVFRTDNGWTLPTSGTGSAAMEAAIGNLVEPGETMLVSTNGSFGDRMASKARRAGPPSRSTTVWRPPRPRGRRGRLRDVRR